MLRTLISTFLAGIFGTAKAVGPLDSPPPWIIAHRGASGYAIEHTVEAYTKAHAQGADFIEQDVVLTRDGIPIVLHDLYLDLATDVSERFPGRSREDGHYYAIDFDWEEIQQLEKQPSRNPVTGFTRYPGRYVGAVAGRVMSFAESLELIEKLNRESGREVGIFPELKMPRFHTVEGQDIGEATLQVLKKYGYLDEGRHFYLQSFDPELLRQMRNRYGDQLRLVQLIGENHWPEAEGTDFETMRSAEGLDRVAEYANAIGPHWPQLLRSSEPDSLVEAAHARGLKVFTFTLRREGLPRWIGFEALHLKLFVDLKVDGIFTDFPDQSKKIRDGAFRRVDEEN